MYSDFLIIVHTYTFIRVCRCRYIRLDSYNWSLSNLYVPVPVPVPVHHHWKWYLLYLQFTRMPNILMVQSGTNLNTLNGPLTSSNSSPTNTPPVLLAAPLGLSPQTNTAILVLSLWPANEMPRPVWVRSRVTMMRSGPSEPYFFLTLSVTWMCRWKFVSNGVLISSCFQPCGDKILFSTLWSVVTRI